MWRKTRIVGGGIGAALVLAAAWLVYAVPCCAGCCLLWGWLPVCSSILCGQTTALVVK